MTDEYIENLHRLREQSYEETKNMSSAELVEYFHSTHEWFENQVAECRARRAAEQKLVPSNTTNR